jgi:hypothetical protein
MENKNLTENAEQLIKEELESARGKFSNLNSSHEGYAVVLEEFEELKEEIEAFEQNIQALWKAVKGNDAGNQAENIRHMEAIAKKIIKEGVQLGAMCRRYSEDILNK